MKSSVISYIRFYKIEEKRLFLDNLQCAPWKGFVLAGSADSYTIYTVYRLELVIYIINVKSLNQPEAKDNIVSLDFFWKYNFPMNQNVYLSVGLSVGLSVCRSVCLCVGRSVQKKCVRIFQMSEF